MGNYENNVEAGTKILPGLEDCSKTFNEANTLDPTGDFKVAAAKTPEEFLGLNHDNITHDGMTFG